MQSLVKLTKNSLYAVQIRKYFCEFCKCRSEKWMQAESDHNVLDYWKLPNRTYFVKIKKDDELDVVKYVKNTLPAHLRAFVLSNSKRIRITFIKNIYFFTKLKYFREIRTVCILKKKLLGVIGQSWFIGR